MKNYSWITALLVLLGLTICVPVPVVSVEPVPPVVSASGTFEKYGPRVYDLIFEVAGDPLTQAYMLEQGQIYVIGGVAPGYYADLWIDDPEIVMEMMSEMGWYEFDLNNQMWPIGHGEMKPVGWTGNEPAVTTGHYWINYTCQRCLDARQFRRALAHLTDRSAMVAHMEGYAAPMETFIFPVIADWENPAPPKYAYSWDLAEQALIEGGFQDWDDDLVLEYSPGHDGVVVEELPTLQGWIRSDDPDRTFAGIQLRDDMMRMGIPLDMPVADRSTCYYHAWVAYDYHIYTGGWSWTRDPTMYYELFHSEKDTYPASGADNYVRYHSQEFDPVGKALINAPDRAAAKTACDQAQMIIHRDVAAIPLYTHEGYTAHRKYYGNYPEEEVYEGLKWEGFVNELGVGFTNFWSFLNAHPQGFGKGGTLRQGLLVSIEKFSPVHAEWLGDWLVLDEIYEPLIKNHPYNLTEKIPWLCRNWTIGTWEFAGKNCTKIRFELFPGILWHDNTPLTVEDVAFTFAYMKDEVSIANYRAVANYYGAITSANGSGWWGPQLPPDTIEILYDVESWFALDWVAGVPIIPKHIWEGKDSSIWNPEDHDAVIGTGPFMCKKDGVVGRPDFTFDYVHLGANPTYYRRYVWPDVCAAGGTIGRDGVVTMFDYGVVAEPGHIGTYDPRLFPNLPPWPTEWIVDGDQLLDVDKNGAIDIEDLLEISLYSMWAWPPPWYVDC